MTDRAPVLIPIVLAAIVAAVFVQMSAQPAASGLPSDRRGEDGFASNVACQSCHPSEWASWRASFHSAMTEPASRERIIGAFDGRTLRYQGRTYRVLQDGEVFLVDMPAFHTVGTRAEDRWVLPVVMLTGSHEMQAYWVKPPQEPVDDAARDRYRTACGQCHFEDAPDLDEQAWTRAEFVGLFKDAHTDLRLDDDVREHVVKLQFRGRLAQFPFVWLAREQQWVHEEDSFLQPEEETSVHERPGDPWSFGCDGCHATGVASHYKDRTNVVESGAVDLGIACESCHGPAEKHAARFRDPRARWSTVDDNAIVNPRKLGPDRASQICAQCHAETESKKSPEYFFKPGEDLGEHVHFVEVFNETPAWLKEVLEDDPERVSSSFWPDGTVRVSGRDYNGLRISACATKGGLSCLSCHAMHKAAPDDQLKVRGDASCTGCHADLEDDHTHHEATSTGSRCMNCHMPHTSYGLMKGIRAHRIDSPRPEGARPNACNLCHLDKSRAWTAEHLDAWYGREYVVSDLGPAGTEWLHGDAVQRTLSAWHLASPAARDTVEDTRIFDEALLLAWDDPYAAVRYQAARALRLDRRLEGLVLNYVDPQSARDDVANTMRTRLNIDDARWFELQLQTTARDDETTYIAE